MIKDLEIPANCQGHNHQLFQMEVIGHLP